MKHSAKPKRRVLKPRKPSTISTAVKLDPGARQQSEIDNQTETHWINQLRALGQIQASKSECAAVLDLTEEQLETFFERHPEAIISYENGLKMGRLAIKRRLLEVAMGNTRENSTPALKLLATHYLRLGDPNHADPNFDAIDMLNEEINQIMREAEEQRFREATNAALQPRKPLNH